jgi:hypothetical protein
MLANRFAVADVDSHIIEPPDLWTSRLGSRWKKIVPHVDHDPRTDKDWWFVGERRMNPVGGYAHAGWPDWFPSYPPTFEGINRGSTINCYTPTYLDSIAMSSSAKAWSSRRNVFKPTTIFSPTSVRRTHPGSFP